jgi:phosphatidylserine/phosphatidylglycerophosphate/cardiolipin synthase-like enzyme
MPINKINTLLILLLIVLIGCKSDKEKVFTADTNFCNAIHRIDSISLSKSISDLAPLMETKTGVYVLEDGGGSLITRAWMCEYAEKTIDIQYFIFSFDNIGLIACDYLVRAADRGVKVRILVDDIMVNAEIEDILSLDAHENISIRIYNPGVNLGKSIFSKIKKFTTEFRSANQRMHNKTFIVDGQTVITGGRNVADEYFDYDHEYNFRDRDVLLVGKVCKDINESFEDFWNHELSVEITDLAKDGTEIRTDPNRFDKLHEYACNPYNFWPQIRDEIDQFHHTISAIKNSDRLKWIEDVSFISDVPGKNTDTKGLGGGGATTDTLINLVRQAKHNIEIQTPYLITSELSRNLFKEATERGVQIRILTNSLSSTDNVEAFSSYQTDREKLLNTGVQIFEFKPDAEIRRKIMTGELQSKISNQPIFGHHAKSMVVDDYITVIGTFNLDPRSANLNTECIAIIKDSAIAKQVLKGMKEEIKPENAWEISKDFNPDGEVSKMKRIKTWTRKILPKEIL